MDTGNGGIGRHVAQGAETSSGGAQVAVVGDVQVDGVSLQERRRGEGATERSDTTTNGY